MDSMRELAAGEADQVSGGALTSFFDMVIEAVVQSALENIDDDATKDLRDVTRMRGGAGFATASIRGGRSASR